MELRNLRGRLLTKHELEQSGLNIESIQEGINSAQKIQGIDHLGHGKQCQRCHNQEVRWFGQLPSQETYCVKCIQMGRVVEGESLYYWTMPDYLDEIKDHATLTWSGNLSKEQERASTDLLASFEDKDRPHLIHAVTGAGKTEITFQIIKHVLELGGNVCLASPRVDVCLELYPRIKAAFVKATVGLLYGKSEERYHFSDILITTTHQMLRFKAAFNLVIVDEVDAFPYVNDETLHYAVQRAIKPKIGKLVYLTATPDKTLQVQINQELITSTVLPARFHGYPLPDPEFKWLGDWKRQILKQKAGKLWSFLSQFMTIHGRKLIFLPDIALAETLLAWIHASNSDKSILCVHAKDPDRKTKVEQLREGKIDSLITTTILERGVTFPNCHVCVVGAESDQFTAASLVQMSGRVGRKAEYPTGKVIFAHYGISEAMISARNQIKRMNNLARKKGLLR